MFGSRNQPSTLGNQTNNLKVVASSPEQIDHLKMPPLLHAFFYPSNSRFESATRFMAKSPRLDGKVIFHDPVGGLKGFVSECITIGCIWGSLVSATTCGVSGAISVLSLIQGQGGIVGSVSAAGASLLSALFTRSLWSYGNRRVRNQLQIERSKDGETIEPKK